jgi:quinol monooxygenase YgiN
MPGKSFRLIVHQTINPGGLEEFRRVAQQGAANAESGEPGTLGYEFFINEEGSDCYLNEYYVDSVAFLEHFGRVQPILEASMKVSSLQEAVVLGDPSPEARALLDHLGAKYYSDCIGFCR